MPVRIDPKQRCECPKRVKTARWNWRPHQPRRVQRYVGQYMGRPVCGNCSGFIVGTAEAAALTDELARRDKRHPTPVLSDEDVQDIIMKELMFNASETNTRLRRKVAEAGNWTKSKATFARFATDIRRRLGIRCNTGQERKVA